MRNTGSLPASRGTGRRLPPWARSALKLAVAAAVVLGLLRYQLLRPVGARVATVERGEVVREVFGRGTIESRREAQLGFDVVGRISDVLVDEGDRVKLGQVVAHLAPDTYAADIRSAATGVALAKAATSRLDADERKANATLELAKAEEARMRTLSQSGTVSQRELDLAVQQLALARAEVERVQAAREEARRQISVARGAVEVRNVAASRAALVSPFDGVVIRRLRDPGDTVTVGTTVLRVVATDALWSRAWIDEAALPLLRERQPARVRFGAEGAPGASGLVDRIGREVDRQTHELLVDVLLADPPPRVAIGQRADVWIEVERKKDVVRLPLAFVRHDARGPYCQIDRGGRVAVARLALGLRGTDAVEVREGVEAGDVVLDAPEPGASLPEGRRWAAVAP